MKQHGITKEDLLENKIALPPWTNIKGDKVVLKPLRNVKIDFENQIIMGL